MINMLRNNKKFLIVNLILIILAQFVHSQKIPANRTFKFFKPHLDKKLVYHGEKATIDECPYIVAILDYNGNIEICTGTAIAAHWVVTAAHCVDSFASLIRYNSASAISGGNTTRIFGSYPHPEYYAQIENDNVYSLENDVALMRTVDEMIIITSIPYPVVPTSYKLEGTVADVYGFGFTSIALNSSGSLMKTELMLHTCKHLDNYKPCICAKSIPDNPLSSVCSGDSGGPIFHYSYLIAVISLGEGICSQDDHLAFMTVLTDYSPANEFFEITMRKGNDISLGILANSISAIPLTVSVILYILETFVQEYQY